MDGDGGEGRSRKTPVYLILGAYGGVGRDLATRLSTRGAQVILAGRDIEKLSIAADQLGAPFIQCDVTNFDEMKSCIERAQQSFGQLDGVANCTGSIMLKPAHLTSEEDWSSVISVNLTAAFATVKYASKAMMGRGGSIVLVSSCAARFGLPNHEAIAAAKAGVEGLVRSAAATYARHQIRINCVAPGLLRTGMSRAIISNEVQLQASIDMHPLGRVGNASDVSAVIDFLLSDESTWITGQSIAVDGGLSRARSVRSQRVTVADQKATAKG